MELDDMDRGPGLVQQRSMTLGTVWTEHAGGAGPYYLRSRHADFPVRVEVNSAYACHLDHALVQSALFQAISPAARHALSSALDYVVHRKGEIVFAEGERAQALFILLSGKVKVWRGAGDGRNVLSLIGPSDMFGEVGVLDPGPRTATASVLADASLARLSSVALQQRISERPEIGEELLRVLARRIRRTDEAMADQVFADVRGRLAKALLAMADRFGTREPDGVSVEHDLTQEELAQLVGASREAVNRALSAFCARGWIRVGWRQVTILDVDRLASRAR